MARYNVCELLAEARRCAEEARSGRRVLRLNSSQQKAVDILVRVMKGSAKAPLGGVQGPPGTGKTSVVESFVHDHMADMLNDMLDELVIYIAPTNHLVAQAFERVVAALLARGYTLRDIVDRARVYGSKVTVRDCEKVFRAKGVDESPPSETALKSMVYGPVDPAVVRIVFATEYQRVSGRFTSKPGRIHLVVDEASKSPYYRAFISIADAIMRYSDYPASLVVLGDPEQAITVPETFRAQRVSLLMNKVMYLVRQHGLERDNFVMLDTTYRLPGPSEQPISHGFYDDRLRAYEPARWRLRSLRELFEDTRTRVERMLRSTVSWSTELDKLFNAVYEAVTSEKPLVVVETGEFSAPRTASTYDKRRTKLGLEVSLILQAYARAARELGSYAEFSTMVIAPYSDIVTNVAFNFKHSYGQYFEPPLSATVQAVIGGEADAVVAILGKEYSGRSDYDPWVDDNFYQTMYYNEPQVLNVQLSRHHKLMVVIGAVRKLARAGGSWAGRRLSRTAQKMLELAERGDAVWVRLA